MSEAGFELVAAVLSFAGSVLFLAGAIGLHRLPDFFTRLHAPTKAATLGIMLIAMGSTLIHLGRDVVVWPEDALIILFVMLTTPVSSQMLARAAARRRVPTVPETTGEALPGNGTERAEPASAKVP